jgi:hypothetical protein
MVGRTGFQNHLRGLSRCQHASFLRGSLKTVRNNYYPVKHGSVLLAFIVTLVSIAHASVEGCPLRIRLTVSNPETGKEFLAPIVLVRDGSSARVQFMAGADAVDLSFSPRIEHGNVRLVMQSFRKDETGKSKPSELCLSYLTPFDSEVGMKEGRLWFRVVVSRIDEADRKQPNQRPEHNAGAACPSDSTPPVGVAHP